MTNLQIVSKFLNPKFSSDLFFNDNFIIIMDPFQKLIEGARRASRRIVLPEGEDWRILTGGVKAASEGIAHIVILGNPEKIRQLGKAQGLPLDSVELLDPTDSEHLEAYAIALQEARAHKKMSLEKARKLVLEPLYFGNLMVRQNAADGCVAGANHTTSEVILTALQTIGKHENYALVSSFFIMIFAQPFHALQGTIVFADCGLVIDPNAEELAQIAIASADSARQLLGFDPRVALLSFSTNRSAKHVWVDKVVEATRLAQGARSDIQFFGDVQFDAALEPDIMAHKAPDFKVDQPANIFIFPNLEAGNIAYKIAERLAQAEAIGPIMQGLKQPVNDLSRGCTAEDVFKAIVVTVMQAEHSQSK